MNEKTPPFYPGSWEEFDKTGTNTEKSQPASKQLSEEQLKQQAEFNAAVLHQNIIDTGGYKTLTGRNPIDSGKVTEDESASQALRRAAEQRKAKKPKRKSF